MAKTKISEMALFSSTFTGEELFPAVQNGENVAEQYKHIVSRIIDVTREQAELLVDGGNLLVGCLYRISGVHPSLYSVGTEGQGNTIILRAAAPDKFSEDGIGYFYEPNYSSMNGHSWNGVAYPEDGSDPYAQNEKFVWGGLVYRVISATPIVPVWLSSFELDNVGTDIELIPFGGSDYEEVLQKIKYDFVNDFITYREDNKGNKVSVSYAQNIFLEQTLSSIAPSEVYRHPIEAFGWGISYIRGNIVTDSFFLCVNVPSPSTITDNIITKSIFSGLLIEVTPLEISDNTLETSFCIFGSNETPTEDREFSRNFIKNSTISNGSYYGICINNTIINCTFSTFGCPEIDSSTFVGCNFSSWIETDPNSFIRKSNFQFCSFTEIDTTELGVTECNFNQFNVSGSQIGGGWQYNNFDFVSISGTDITAGMAYNRCSYVEISDSDIGLGSNNILDHVTITCSGTSLFTNSQISHTVIQGNLFGGITDSFISQSQVTLGNGANLINCKLFQSIVNYLETDGSLQNCILDYSIVDLSLTSLPVNPILRYLHFSYVEFAPGDLTSATLVYLSFYKTVYGRPDGTPKIKFYNDSDVLTIAEITD